MTRKDMKNKETYTARIGCWNCDTIYEIFVAVGTMTSQYLVDSKLKCKKCGCQTLKMFTEYRIDKKIMKDVMLHHRIEHPPEEEERKNKTHDHYQ